MSRVSFAKLARAEALFERAVEAPKASPGGRGPPRPRTPPPPPSAPVTFEPAALRTAAIRAARPKPLVTVQIPPKAQAIRIAPDPAGAVKLTARALKVSVTLDPAQVAAIPLRDNAPAPPFVVAVDGRRLRSQVTAKSLRKVLAMIAEHGPATVVTLQGKLAEGDVIAEAGLVAQVRQPPPEKAAPSN